MSQPNSVSVVRGTIIDGPTDSYRVVSVGLREYEVRSVECPEVRLAPLPRSAVYLNSFAYFVTDYAPHIRRIRLAV